MSRTVTACLAAGGCVGIVAVYDRRGDRTLAAAGTYATGALGGRLDAPDFGQPASQVGAE